MRRFLSLLMASAILHLGSGAGCGRDNSPCLGGAPVEHWTFRLLLVIALLVAIIAADPYVTP